MDLSTSYLGLQLGSPFLIGASPCCDDIELARMLQDAGAGAVVMRSLFQEQLATERREPARGGNAWCEFPAFTAYLLTPDSYLRHLEFLRRSLSIPVIASLNGHHPGRWVDFAPRLEDAGASAIELNFYQVVTDPTIAADFLEREILETIDSICGAVRIPVAVKLSPFVTSVAQLAVAAELAGAAGIVVFNRFYQPDIDTDKLTVRPLLRLSEPGELLLRLRWLAILSPLLRGSLSATGGIHSSDGVVKALLAGAHTTQLVSTVLQHGAHVLTSLREGLEQWMRLHGYARLDQFRGRLNLAHCADTEAYERANYLRVLQSWDADRATSAKG
jgi:dihydroorotate dehydrogenase (fumarate)